MGMFDEVRANCPDCNEEILFQSKGGECVLEVFDVTAVPMAVATDIRGSECGNCGRWCNLENDPTIPTHIRMRVA